MMTEYSNLLQLNEQIIVYGGNMLKIQHDEKFEKKILSQFNDAEKNLKRLIILYIYVYVYICFIYYTYVYV
jgi:hypothetical protein